jgi:hypothetical protein
VPRYYFDFHDNGQISVDDEGSVLENRNDAKLEAVRALAEIANDALAKVKLESLHSEPLEFALIVRDDQDQEIARARVRVDLT